MRRTVVGHGPRGVAWVLVAAVGVAGCGPTGPKTFPVAGKIVMAKGGDLPKGLVGASVEFQSTTEPNTRAYGEIQPDGSFTLSTYREGLTGKGAIAGTHKGRLVLDLPDDDDRPRRGKLPVDRKFAQFETSGWEITVPVSGPVTLTLP